MDTGGWGVRTDSKVRTPLVSRTCYRYNECVDINNGNARFELMIRNISSERCGGCFANSLSSLNSDPALITLLLANSGQWCAYMLHPTVVDFEIRYKLLRSH